MMADGRGPKAPGGGSSKRRTGWWERAGRWLAAGVAAACLVAAVADSDPVGSFVAGVDVSGRGESDLDDHELPNRTQLRFWPTDTPASVQTLRLSDASRNPQDQRWDLIWRRSQFPITIDRNTTWHIDLTIPAESTP